MDEMGTNFSIQADLPEIVYQDDKVLIRLETSGELIRYNGAYNLSAKMCSKSSYKEHATIR